MPKSRRAGTWNSLDAVFDAHGALEPASGPLTPSLSPHGGRGGPKGGGGGIRGPSGSPERGGLWEGLHDSRNPHGHHEPNTGRSRPPDQEKEYESMRRKR